MAFSDDAVLARLSSLNESHDSIATASQWIMFHRYGAMSYTEIHQMLIFIGLGATPIALYKSGSRSSRIPPAQRG